MGLALALEDFDETPADVAPPPTSPGPSSDWLDGHAAGRIEGLEAASSAQAALNATLVHRLEDMAFGYAEARAMLMAQLVPLFRAVAHKLLPALQDEALSAHLAQALSDAAGVDLDGALVMRVSAKDVVGLSDRLAARADLPFTCRSDPSLVPGMAVLDHGGRETCLDIARVIDGLQAILSAYFEDQPREAAHG